MDSAIIVAIIGGVSAVLAALIQNIRQIRQLRDENTDQHGAVMELVVLATRDTADIKRDVKELRNDVETVRTELESHIAGGGDAMVRPVPRRKPLPKKTR